MYISNRLKQICLGVCFISLLIHFGFTDVNNEYWGYGLICYIILSVIVLCDDLSKAEPQNLILRLPFRIISGIVGTFMLIPMIYLKLSFPEPYGIFVLFMDIFYFSFCFFILYLAYKGYVFKRTNPEISSPNINS